MEEKQNTTAEKLYSVTSSPHIHKKISIPAIMWTVVLCLLPAGAMGVYVQGLKALWVILISVATAVATEFLCQKIRGVKVTLYDGSAVLTGLLFAYVISCENYWYVVVFGSCFSIAVAKHAFGGLGLNIWNPALAGRAFVMASFGLIMTSAWPIVSPCCCENKDAQLTCEQVATSATPLQNIRKTIQASREIDKDSNILGKTPQETWKNIKQKQTPYCALFLGKTSGCIGETSALLLLLGGLILIWRKIVKWQLPLTILLTTAFCAWMFPVHVGFYNPETGAKGLGFVWFAGDPLFHLLSGGCLLGALFMATDMVTSPITVRGQIIFGIGIGILTMIIRLYGGYPEGVSYAILLMNTAVPLIDRYTKPKVFGARQKC